MTESISEAIAAAAGSARIPSSYQELVEKLVIDVAGVCIAARDADFVRAALAGWESDGRCSALGHARALDAAGAAFVNGTAAHGEDFDDTFEGGPVHAGAVVVPAVLAVSERDHLKGADALRGLAGGAGLM